jgi:hypothetical protein
MEEEGLEGLRGLGANPEQVQGAGPEGPEVTVGVRYEHHAAILETAHFKRSVGFEEATLLESIQPSPPRRFTLRGYSKDLKRYFFCFDPFRIGGRSRFERLEQRFARGMQRG